MEPGPKIRYYKRHVVFDASHFPPRHEMIKETLDWLDRYLEPVN